MAGKTKQSYFRILILLATMSSIIISNIVHAQENEQVWSGNFGLPGIIDLPTAKRFPDGELVVTQQIHDSLARSGISFQALPRLGVSFRYSGHGVGGGEAHGRINHDRSFDAHLLVLRENKYLPAISIGLRDFIGTGWYSSEYIVGTKSFGKLDLTMGLGFGRLAGRNSFSNPLEDLSSRFRTRQRSYTSGNLGGTFGNINWFHGNASFFYGINYRLGEKVKLSAEYNPDLMIYEGSYLESKSPWNLGLQYGVNNFLSLGAQYLHGNKFSFTTHVTTNPARPPFLGGKELAPVPMRLREIGKVTMEKNNEKTIKKVLHADDFVIHKLRFEAGTVYADVTNTKFRSTAQAVGRVASTLQRFTADSIRFAIVSLYKNDLKVASYKIDLQQVTKAQFNPSIFEEIHEIIIPVDKAPVSKTYNQQRFSWGVGPYVTHRLFNPDLPLSAETGVEVESSFQILPGFNLSGSFRKSILTNLTDNKRRSNSVLPRVHSDWPLYDFAGQEGHINDLTISYITNLAPGFYGRAHAGLLEPFFAGFGGEILYKPSQSSLAIGLDFHRVIKRDYDMKFDLLDYATNIGHISIYYDAGEMFDIEVNAGRYLAGDWGATTTISRKFGSGWEVGGYATLTDVPFETFGEGSFDKAIYVSIPIDWIVSTPTMAQRRLTLRPITRDGGANLATARSLYRNLERSQSAQFKREYGRLWK